MSRGPKRKTLRLAAGLVIVLLAASTFLLWRNGNRTSRETFPDATRPSDAPSTGLSLPQPSRTTSSKVRGLDARNYIHAAIQALEKSNSADGSRRVLAELGAALGALPKEEASKAIQEILTSGIDVQTHIDFEVGQGVRLGGANTLRVFLLDYLGEIDPKAASETAMKILSKLEAPDEWAVSLRNYARTNSSPDSQNFLRDRVRVLLAHEPWQQDPTTGYLEAFDVVVHLGGGQLVPELTRLLRLTNNQAVAHAAYLATDRLAINDPVPVLSALGSDASLMEGRETTRAGFFARADVSNLDQYRLLESYLLNPGLKPDELDAFADLFPNENYRISHNLLTATPPRPGSVIQQRDREALRAVEDWMKQDRFKAVLPQLQTIQKRLWEFTSGSR